MGEEGLAAFAHALREVCADRDASRAHVNAVQWDFSTSVCASSSQSR
jgi:hypothetical protein